MVTMDSGMEREAAIKSDRTTNSAPMTPLGRRHRAFPAVVSDDQLVSVDVFDTLLYRKPVSERRRFFLAAAAFLRMCPERVASSAWSIGAARSEANRWAYHALDTRGCDGEVRLADVLLHQLRILGLPAALLPLLMAAEMEVEKRVLLPNRPLVEWLDFQRARQVRVIAISDTAMPGAALQEIVDSVIGHRVVDRLYTSADLGLSKRNGGIFAAVASLEGRPLSLQLHLGDDETADVSRARAAGARPTHLPRSRMFVARRKLDGACFRAESWLNGATPSEKATTADPTKGDARAFGNRVLGPIFATYCMRLWLYLSFADQSDGGAVALFCARGGLQLKTIFEVFLDRVGLPLDAPRQDFMVSRLVAVRAALLHDAPSAFDEIGREFTGASMATIARALAQSDIGFGPDWDAPFDAQTFARLIRSTPDGGRLRRRLVEQNDLFLLHLQRVTAERTRLVLCDTGLYGSTVRTLQEAVPERHWECLLFARSNYKGFSSSHFANTRGIVSEQDLYDPLRKASTVLRYWQLIEHVFEPELQSVKTFTADGQSAVTSNLETGRWRERMHSSRSPLLQGIVDYLQDLPADWFEQVRRDEPHSWRMFKRAVVYPDANDLQALNTGERSHDFGRDEKYSTMPRTKTRTGLLMLRHLRTSRWKEGYVAQECGPLRPLAQAAIEAVYVLRWAASGR